MLDAPYFLLSFGFDSVWIYCPCCASQFEYSVCPLGPSLPCTTAQTPINRVRFTRLKQIKGNKINKAVPRLVGKVTDKKSIANWWKVLSHTAKRTTCWGVGSVAGRGRQPVFLVTVANLHDEMCRRKRATAPPIRCFDGSNAAQVSTTLEEEEENNTTRTTWRLCSASYSTCLCVFVSVSVLCYVRACVYACLVSFTSPLPSFVFPPSFEMKKNNKKTAWKTGTQGKQQT